MTAIVGTGVAVVAGGGGAGSVAAVIWLTTNTNFGNGSTYQVPQFNAVLSDPSGIVISADGSGQAPAGTKIIRVPTTGLWRLAWDFSFHDPTVSTAFTNPATAAGSPFHLFSAGLQSDQGSSDPASWWNAQLCAIFGGPSSSGVSGYASNDAAMAGSADVPLQQGDTVEPFIFAQFAITSLMYWRGGSFFSAALVA